MKIKRSSLIQSSLGLLTFAAFLWSAILAGAQSQTMTTPQDRDNDVTRQQLAGLDHFLDVHPEISEQLRKDPSLVDNKEFVENHAALKQYLQEHPEVREELSENPNGMMRQEQRYDRREDRGEHNRDTTHGELANMDRFLDSHPEIAEQLRKDPSLVNNKEFAEHHPALQQFLTEHPGVREEIKENPSAFMHQEQRFDRHEDFRNHDTTRGELANMDHFLDSHPEIAEQLRKDPSLVNNKEFVEHHGALRQFLGEHPEVSEEIKENPNSFMHREQGFDRRESVVNGRDRDGRSTELSSFGEFLGSHSNINSELSKNPSLAKNQEYLENHPALRDYLKDHPNAHKELTENPQAFLQSAQQSVGTPKVAKVAPKLK